MTDRSTPLESVVEELRERVRLWRQEAETSIARTRSDVHARVYELCALDIEALIRQALSTQPHQDKTP